MRSPAVSFFSVLLLGASAGFAQQPTADIELFKDTNPPGLASVIAGTGLAYTISATNNGPDAALDVVITDQTPAGTNFSGVVPSAGGSCSTTPVGIGFIADITCTWPGMTANGATRSVEVTVTVCAEVQCASDIVNNMAFASSSTFDPLPGNNAQMGVLPGLGTVADVVTPVETQSQFQMTKSGPATATGGAQVTYTIQLANLGPSTAEAALVDQLPAGWTVVSADSAFYGPCLGVGTSTVNCTIPLGAPNICPPLPTSDTVTIVAQVPPAASGVFTNVAQVSSSNCLPDTGDLTASAQTAVNRPGELAIPTLSEAGLAVFFAGLLILGLWSLRRKQGRLQE